MPATANRLNVFTESVIRGTTRLANQYGAINLSQGFPDFPMPESMKEAACDAIRRDFNQYATTWGTKTLRDAIAGKYARRYGMEVDPDAEITVACGGTEAMASVFLALIDPGDEVLIFEPFYENYGPDAILSEARPVFVPLSVPDWTLDVAALRAAVSPKTPLLSMKQVMFSRRAAVCSTSARPSLTMSPSPCRVQMAQSGRIRFMPLATAGPRPCRQSVVSTSIAPTKGP